jgi:hypothetical protein
VSRGQSFIIRIRLRVGVTLSIRMLFVTLRPQSSAPSPSLKTVGLNIRTGSSPVSGTIGKSMPVDDSAGFVILTPKNLFALFILLVWIFWQYLVHFRRRIAHGLLCRVCVPHGRTYLRVP